MSFTGRLALMFLGLWFLCLAPALAQEKPPEKPWTGKLWDGQKITKQDLDNIIKKHNLWLVGDKNGKQADLEGADLKGAPLNGQIVGLPDLRGANMGWAKLDGANLRRADLGGAELHHAQLIEADLYETNLHGADLYGANLSKTIFEPRPGFINNLMQWVKVTGLRDLTYIDSPHALLELREGYKKGGIREAEREITFALNRNQRIKLWKRGAFMDRMESLFNLICFEWTCQYGMNPGRPLKILGLGLLLFTLTYMLALRSNNYRSGIWVVPISDRVPGRDSKTQPYKLTPRILFRPLPDGWCPRFRARAWRVLRVLRLAFYFSLLSAFNLGWRELNVGNWISRVQKREYVLRGQGWVRTVAGLQSILSVYLLALWVLTYFGRPFE